MGQTSSVLESRTTLKGHDGWVWAAVFSPHGRTVLTASQDMTARLWDAASGTCLATLAGHHGSVLSATFSPDGRMVVTASEDKTARLWDIGAAGSSCVATLHGHSGVVATAAFSPDGGTVVTASWDKTARLWDVATGRCMATLKGHSDWVRSAAFSPDGRTVVTPSKDGTARLWDAASGMCLATLAGHSKGVTCAAFSPDGRKVVTASEDRTARLWDAASGSCVATLAGHGKGVTCAAFSPDGHTVVTASWDSMARLWDAASGSCVATLEGHTEAVVTAAFSPDGSAVVTASDDKTAQLWDVASGRCAATLKGHGKGVTSAAFSPDGRTVVTATACGSKPRLWDIPRRAPGPADSAAGGSGSGRSGSQRAPSQRTSSQLTSAASTGPISRGPSAPLPSAASAPLPSAPPMAPPAATSASSASYASYASASPTASPSPSASASASAVPSVAWGDVAPPVSLVQPAAAATPPQPTPAAPTSPFAGPPAPLLSAPSAPPMAPPTATAASASYASASPSPSPSATAVPSLPWGAVAPSASLVQPAAAGAPLQPTPAAPASPVAAPPAPLPSAPPMAPPAAIASSGSFGATAVPSVPWGDVAPSLSPAPVAAGAFKRVHRAELRGTPVAVLRFAAGADPATELSVFAKLGRHKHLMPLVATTRDPDSRLCLIQEWQSCGSLDAVLGGLEDEGRRPVDSVLLRAAMQVAEGMEHLTSEGLIHRDLAARNVLMREFDPNDPRRVWARVTDYGLTADGTCYYSSGTALPVRWMAPEALQRRRFSEKSDVWAFGVLLYEIWSGVMVPYVHLHRDEDASRFVCGGGTLERPPGMPEPVAAVMERCFARAPAARPTFSQLRSDLLDAVVAMGAAGPGGNREGGEAVCPLCLDSVEGGGKHVLVPCGHGPLHGPCVEELLRRSPLCLMCRNPVTCSMQVFV